MSMEVEIRIAGDAIIYEKNEMWIVAFIVDEHHLVNAKADGKPIGTGHLGVTGVYRSVKIISDGTKDRTRTRGTDHSSLLNMGDRPFHPKVSDTVSNLTVNPKFENKNRGFVELMIPFGMLDAVEWVDGYWWEQYSGGTSKGEITTRVGVVAAITFQVDRESPVVMQIDQPGHHEKIEFKYQEGNHLVIDLDNDCAEQFSTRNDFLNYYDWVQDKRDTEKVVYRYIAGRINNTLDIDGNLVKRLSSTVGNCDPVIIDPEPGP